MLRDKPVSALNVSSISCFVLLFFAVYLVSAIMLSLENLDMETTLSAPVALLTDTGVGFGKTADAAYDAAFAHALVPPNRLALLPGIGLDLALWNRTSVNAAGKSDIRQELGLSPADKLFLMVAEFNPGKRHRDALEALAIAGRKDLHLAYSDRKSVV